VLFAPLAILTAVPETASVPTAFDVIDIEPVVAPPAITTGVVLETMLHAPTLNNAIGVKEYPLAAPKAKVNEIEFTSVPP
jgi:hypothetical protein